MRSYMRERQISYYYLSNQGIDSATLHRIRHDRPITTETLEKICRILNCQPGQLMKYVEEVDDD
ncbi:MAG: helix-turn-helix transcriptional regulator [Clostridiales bacterium]|nr:helix-turn-helix transcriptional regulator [Clostridiales bacterium]